MKTLKKKLNYHTCIMHLCLLYPMQLCRWAGFFPYDPLNEVALGSSRFNFRCFYLFYCTASLIGQAILAGFSFYQLISHQMTIASLSNFIFYGTSVLSAILFLRLGRNCSEFLKNAIRLESFLNEKRTKKLQNKHGCKINIVAFTVMGLALVETLLSVVFVMNLVMDCIGEFALSAKVLESYFLFRMPSFYDYTSYTVWKAILLEIANMQATFLWSFTDVLTMCFSLYLISYCKNLSRVIYYKKQKNISSWEKIRIQYCHLMTLIRLVDSQLKYFILLGFFVDLFYICLQIFNTLNQGYSGFHNCGQKGLDAALNGLAHSVYYWFSFLFLMLRAMLMSLLASHVHATARKPIHILTTVPASAYNIEVQRIENQITYTKLSLSGIFFHVTRDMILKVAASIVTYELVLLQFSRGHGKVSTKTEDNQSL